MRNEQEASRDGSITLPARAQQLHRRCDRSYCLRGYVWGLIHQHSLRHSHEEAVIRASRSGMREVTGGVSPVASLQWKRRLRSECSVRSLVVSIRAHNNYITTIKSPRHARSAVWSGREDLASGPASSLTVAQELRSFPPNRRRSVASNPLDGLLDFHIMVGARGFEPPTSCSQSRRATGLRYAPTACRLHILGEVTPRSTDPCITYTRTA